jgi:HAMP domain-containing protein
MSARAQLSIRARLTLFFVLAIAVVLTFTGFALVSLVHRSLVSGASNQIADEMVQIQSRFATSTLPTGEKAVLAMRGDVVVQVTNMAGTEVWAASSAIADAPVLAHAKTSSPSTGGLGVLMAKSARTSDAFSQVSLGQVQTIGTSRGEGLIFGFVYGGPISHSVTVLLVSVAVSFPLLLLISGGLIWFGIGLALAPVEAIRRRVDAIAAEDLTQRVPVTGGDDEIARMARTVNEMLGSAWNRLRASNRSSFRTRATSCEARSRRCSPRPSAPTADQASANWPEVAGTSSCAKGADWTRIIDGLFWLARHDENQIDVTSVDVDLDDLLFEESQRIRSISELNVDTSAVQPTRVVGDQAMLKRMIRNVVDNAARYAVSELRFGSSYDGPYAVVTVSDDGDGVDVAESARFFERFVRADPARSRQSGGTGLGLSIVTDIVTRHGGSARFIEVAKGSTIELRVRRDGGNNVSKRT